MIVLAEYSRRFRRLFRAARAPFLRRASPDPGLAESCADLPEPTRSVYLLSARDDLSFEQIAVRLDLPVATVERELAHALFVLARDDNAVTSRPLNR
jgi:DNA-directed RNA polymerase specialized sigma24 family protein